MENLKKDGFALRAGFSLIELLIVITIIGILAVAFLPSITEGPSRARDTQRIADMSDIALALELYYQDTGNFPTPAGGLAEDNASLIGYFDNNEVPTDPQGAGNPNIGTAGLYYYSPCNLIQGYVIVAHPENAKAVDNYYNDLSTSTICDDSSWAAADITDPDDNYYVLYKNID